MGDIGSGRKNPAKPVMLSRVSSRQSTLYFPAALLKNAVAPLTAATIARPL
jgi:hypothetical protein